MGPWIAPSSSAAPQRPTPVTLAGDTVVFIGRSILRLPRGIFWLLRHCCVALANGKTFWGWYMDLVVGAFPPLFWTFSFKQARRIPDEWRPKIHTDLLPPAEDFIMSPLGVLLFTAVLSPVALALWRSAGSAPFPFTTRYSPTVGEAHYLPLRTTSISSSLGDELTPADKETLSAEMASTVSSSSSSDNGVPLAEAEHASYQKIYALIVLTYPSLLYCMHILAFTPIRAYKDLMAWGTYGALHFASPIVIGWWLWFFAPPGAARTFGWCLGGQNLAGLFTHIIFPNAAPWFYDEHGASLHPFPPPDYNTPGSAAGLVRVDVILGTRLYASGFKKSPVVFGAFPSLHAATAVISALFVARYSRKAGLIVMFIYAYWMFWSTMYFHHHYAVDLIGGTFYSSIAFGIALQSGVLARIDARHADEQTTIGWDRVFLGGGWFGTSFCKSWGSGHWDVRRGLPTSNSSGNSSAITPRPLEIRD